MLIQIEAEDDERGALWEWEGDSVPNVGEVVCCENSVSARLQTGQYRVKERAWRFRHNATRYGILRVHLICDVIEEHGIEGGLICR